MIYQVLCQSEFGLASFLISYKAFIWKSEKELLERYNLSTFGPVNNWNVAYGAILQGFIKVSQIKAFGSSVNPSLLFLTQNTLLFISARSAARQQWHGPALLQTTGFFFLRKQHHSSCHRTPKRIQSGFFSHIIQGL
ncbi:unnamed protein product [Absidia cylindrospora]